jgi:hypothetical protein
VCLFDDGKQCREAVVDGERHGIIDPWLWDETRGDSVMVFIDPHLVQNVRHLFTAEFLADEVDTAYTRGVEAGKEAVMDEFDDGCGGCFS